MDEIKSCEKGRRRVGGCYTSTFKTYAVLITVRAENVSDLKERMEDLTENPIDHFNEKSIQLLSDAKDRKFQKLSMKIIG